MEKKILEQEKTRAKANLQENKVQTVVVGRYFDVGYA